MAPKKKSREEILLQKRIRERERYKKIKENPIEYRKQKEKEKLKYKNKLKKKQVKLIKDMTEREARLQRKKWRARSKNSYKRKKQIAQDLEKLPASPPLTDDESRPTSPDQDRPKPLSVQKESGKKRVHRDRSKTIQRNKKLEKENKRLRTMVEKYRKKCYRSAVQNRRITETTPRKKVKQLMKSNDSVSVRRQLLLGAALESQLKANFEKIKNPREKKKFVSAVIGDGKVFSKCKISKELQRVFTKRLTRTNANNYIKKRQLKLQTEQRKADVKKFLEDDENSRLAPGKKDFKTNKKLKKQKRYLNDTLLNLHKKFVSSVSYSMSYALFCRYRPFYIVYQKLNERDTCQCKTHTNTDFVVSTLHKHGIINARKPKDMAEELCCNGTYSVSCLLRRCEKCVEKQTTFNEFNGETLLQYFEWATEKHHYTDKNGQVKQVKRTVKLKKTANAIDLVNHFEDLLLKFMKHEAIILNQFSQLKFLKTSMKEDEALIHMDFSENYCTKYGNEIQSFHFGGSRQQITLHTSALRFKETSYAPLKTKTFCTMSQDLNHSPTEIMAHLTPVLKYLNSVKPKLTVLHFLSDSPSTQYRNKDMFYVFSHLIKEFFPHLMLSTWNYFEAGHGKGIPDGVGGTAKRTADRLVAEGKDIDSLETLSNALKDNLRKTEIYVVTSEDIADVKKKIKIHDILTFKGTMQVHQVIQVHDPQKPPVLTMKSMSCFKCINHGSLLSFNCKHNTLGRVQYPTEQDTIITTQPSCSRTVKNHQETIKPTKGELKKTAEGPTAEATSSRPSVESGTEKSRKGRDVYWEDIKIGAYVLVQFTSESGKLKYRYVCSVLRKDEEDGEVSVQGLQLMNDDGNEFCNNDDNDVSNVPFEAILEILDEPKILMKKRKIVYRFDRAVDVFEK